MRERRLHDNKVAIALFSQPNPYHLPRCFDIETQNNYYLDLLDGYDLKGSPKPVRKTPIYTLPLSYRYQSFFVPKQHSL